MIVMIRSYEAEDRDALTIYGVEKVDMYVDTSEGRISIYKGGKLIHSFGIINLNLEIVNDRPEEEE